MNNIQNRVEKSKLHQILVREWRIAVENGDYERAIQIDSYHYKELVKKNEEVVYWDQWQTETLPTRNRLTSSIEVLLPSIDIANKEERRCLIVYHNHSGLAHETQFARNIEWLRSHYVNLNVEIVYLFGTNHRRMHAANLFGVSPVAVHYLQASSYLEAAERLANLAKQRCAFSIIYPSFFFIAFWMSLFVPHPNQKFVQMKYYPQHAGRIKYWFGGYKNKSTHYRINGCDFEQLPVLDIMIAKSLQIDIQTETNRRTVRVGSISRPEKITDGQFNQLVIDLLARHQSLEYVYTGRKESLGLIPEAILRHERSVWLGWVDPISAINKFDIYLEPFPWGGGEMSLLALEAARPYITLSSAENQLFGIYSLIKFIADQGSPDLQYSFCQNVSQLRHRLDELSTNSDLRKNLGQQWREAVLAYRPPSVDSWYRLFND